MKPLAYNDNPQHRPANPKLAYAQSLLGSLNTSLAPDKSQEHTETTVQPEALPRGLVHEAWASNPVDIAAAMAFILQACRADKKPLLWITLHHLSCEYGLPYGPGLVAAGIDPARLILVRCRNEKEAQWALEEGLATKALTAVVGEVCHMDLTASRRLALVAHEHQSRCMLLMRAEQTSSNASYSRWQLSSLSSAATLFDLGAPGTARLQATLVKHRGGSRPTTRTLEWPDAPYYSAVSSPVADRAASQRLSLAGQQYATG